MKSYCCSLFAIVVFISNLSSYGALRRYYAPSSVRSRTRHTMTASSSPPSDLSTPKTSTPSSSSTISTTTPSSATKYFDKILNNLTFGYENPKYNQRMERLFAWKMRNNIQSMARLETRMKHIPLKRNKNENSTTIDMKDRVESQGNQSMSRSSVEPRALCYDTLIRPRGCDALTKGDFSALSATSLTSKSTGAPSTVSPLNLLPLPCVSEGICPYTRFKCARGHRWNAVPGSPVCFTCPQCNAKERAMGSKLRGVKRQSWTSHKILSEIKKIAKKYGGGILIPEDDQYSYNNEINWKSKVRFRCEKGHEWDASAKNVVISGTWCQTCSIEKLKLQESDYEKTAAYFGGKFLGFLDDDDEDVNGNDDENDDEDVFSDDMFQVEDLMRANGKSFRRKKLIPSQRKAYFECQRGHSFVQIMNNIRRKPGSKRACSWCPTCKKEGFSFSFSNLDDGN